MNSITQIAKRHGLTLKELAEKIGISESTLKATIGKNGNPSVNTLKKIANAIGCEVGDFFAPTNYNANTIVGFIKYRGKIKEINSCDDVRELLNEIGQ